MLGECGEERVSFFEMALAGNSNRAKESFVRGRFSWPAWADLHDFADLALFALQTSELEIIIAAHYSNRIHDLHPHTLALR